MKTLRSRQVYAGTTLVVREDEVRRADGAVETRTVVEGRDLVLVVPVEADRLHLVEQYRHPLGRRTWEFPSGDVDPSDADPAATAARELREETGLGAGRLDRLGVLDVMPSTLAQRCIVFSATDLAAGEAHPEPDEEGLRSAWFSRSDVRGMLLDGTLSDAKSCAAYGLLLAHQQ